MSEEVSIFHTNNFYLNGKLIYKYLVSLPLDYDKKQDQKWPLIVAMTGRDACGDNIEQVKRTGIPRMLTVFDKWRNNKLGPDDIMKDDWKPKPSQWGLDPSKKPPKPVRLEVAKFIAENFITVCPQAGKYEYDPDLLSKFTENVANTYRVDKDRIYMTGLSYGGYYTLETAMAHPHQFAALAPICGGRTTKDLKKIAHVPTWIFHGKLDDVMPVSYAEEIAKTLKSFGGNVKITVFPDAYHDSFTSAYNMMELYEWFLAQRRTH